MEHIVKRLRETGGLDAALMRAAADTIETLTAERDAARREVCYASTQPPRECAEDRGWDCWDRKDFCDKL
jgi:hypothetical protein